MAQQPLVGQDLLFIEASRPHSDTPHSAGLSGQVIGPTQEKSDNTQHPYDPDIHAPGGIRNRNPCKRATEDPRIRPLPLGSAFNFRYVAKSRKNYFSFPPFNVYSKILKICIWRISNKYVRTHANKLL